MSKKENLNQKVFLERIEKKLRALRLEYITTKSSKRKTQLCKLIFVVRDNFFRFSLLNKS